MEVGGDERIIFIIFVSDSDYAGALGGCRAGGDTVALYTLYTTHCILHKTYTAYTAYCTLHTTNYTIDTIDCTLHIANWPLHSTAQHCTALHTVDCTAPKVGEQTQAPLFYTH